MGRFCILIMICIFGWQFGLAFQETDVPEATSLLGKPLYQGKLDGDVRAKFEKLLAEAETHYKAHPNDVLAGIWVGRRTAYLGRYNDAIKIFSQLIQKFPNEARLYRHRGHRYISVRNFDSAIADFEKAVLLIKGQPDQVEPDGLPNAFNTPTSTTQSNIWYHLGLAYYLKADYENALRAYEACLKVSKNNDMLCATTHWLYMTLRRSGRNHEANLVLEPINKEMKILENGDYHKLLLMYKEQLPLSALAGDNPKDALQSASLGYGIANWHDYNGHKDKARVMYQKILEGSAWSAFGYIAAEADLAR